MIPKSLTIKGLYSYQNEQVIDFKKLTDAQLFGIFGTVGSGKSSILEAISFALYGDTERLNKSGDNRNYNMLNLKSNELLIDLTFLNHDEQTYRFTVKGRRNGNNFGNVPAFNRSAYKLNNGSWEPIETTADSIIGLSYENFRRTIIIPQGKFQEFLQLGDKDRTNMLKDIFQLEKFEFSRQTASLDQKNDATMQELLGRLNQLGDVTEEAVQSKSELLKDLTDKYKIAKDELAKTETEEAEVTTLKKLFDDQRVKRSLLEDLSKRKPEIDLLQQQIAQYEYCLLQFKGLIDKETSLNSTQTSKKSELRTVSDRLDRIQLELSNDEPKLVAVSAAYNQLESRIKEKSDYETVLSIKAREERQNKEHVKWESTSKQLVELEKEKSGSKQLYDNQKIIIAALKLQIPDLSELGNVQSWFAKMESIKSQLSEVRQEFKDANQRISEKKRKLVEIVPLELNSRFPFSSFDSSAEFLEIVADQEKSNKETLKQSQAQLEQLRVQTQLAAYTAQIADGSPCPLCGSLDHPNVVYIDEVSADISKLEEEISLLEIENNQIAQTIRELNVAVAAIIFQTDQTQQITNRITTLEADTQQHLTTFTWTQFSPNHKEQFDTVRQEAVVKQQELQMQEATLTSLEEKFVAAQKAFDEAKREADSIETEIKIIQGQITTLKSQIQTLDATVFVLDAETIREKISGLTKHIANTTTEYTDLTRRIQNNKIVFATTETEKKGLEKAHLEFSEQLEKSVFSDRSEIETVLHLDLDVAMGKEKITAFNQQLFSAQKDLEVLDQQLANKEFDAVAYESLQQRLNEQKTAAETLNKFCIEAETLFKKLNTDWETKKRLLADFKKLETRKTNIQTFKRLFHASGFVNYISSVYLQQLCEAANERFHKLTRQQLRLEVTDSNTFQVRDFLNEGRLRSVKTLSGGQTFQASLCLALALAESIPQQNRANQNFFFLDEGFGSQDKESLRIVFESLKALRQENRIVGVISHVEELQQEIDTYLTVINDSEKGSLITGSWGI